MNCKTAMLRSFRAIILGVLLAAAPVSLATQYKHLFARSLDRELQLESVTLREALDALLAALWETDPKLKTVDSTLFVIDAPQAIAVEKRDLVVSKQQFGPAISKIVEVFGCSVTIDESKDLVNIRKITPKSLADTFVTIPNSGGVLNLGWKPDENVSRWFSDRGVDLGSGGSAIYLGSSVVWLRCTHSEARLADGVLILADRGFTVSRKSK